MVAEKYKDRKCKRCSYEWRSRDPDKKPKNCPSCNSSLWDNDYKLNVKNPQALIESQKKKVGKEKK